jgi:hypothetical protein
MTEEEARVEYAKWFVRDYYLRKRTVDYDYRWKVRKCQERGYLRYRKITWPVGSKRYLEGEEYVRDENEYSSTYSFFGEKPVETWYRLPWDELDDPINDNNQIVLAYRGYRVLAEENDFLAWLKAEAEYKRVSAEAWLRSYGVDVQAP